MLAKLKARLKELTGELSVLMAKDDMTSDELAKVGETTTAIEGCEKQIEDLERGEAARARSAVPATQEISRDVPTIFAAPKKDLTAIQKVGFAVIAMTKAYVETGAKGSLAAMKELDDAGYGSVAREFDLGNRQRALNASSATAGGLFVPTDISDELIDLLRPQTTFLRAQPRRVMFDNGNFSIPAAATGSTAYWRGEGQRINVSQPSFRDINMSAKLLGALVPMTAQLLRWSRIDIEDWVQRDMAQALGQEIDRAAYFGAGTVNEPLGIATIPGVGHISATAAGASPTAATIETLVSKLELAMDNTNLPQDRAAWIMAPRTVKYLQNLRDGNGNLYYPSMQGLNPVFRDFPVFKTTQVGITGGVGTNESQIMLINFGDVYFGESRALTFAVSDTASYVKNGQTVSAFQNELALIRATTEVDVGLKYLEAVQVLDNVLWGSA